MQGEHLGSEKVLPVFKTFRDMDHLLALVVDHDVCSPSPGVIANTRNLEPIPIRSVSFVLRLSN